MTMASTSNGDDLLSARIAVHQGLTRLLDYFEEDLSKAAGRADALRQELHAADTHEWHPVQEERDRQ